MRLVAIAGGIAGVAPAHAQPLHRIEYSTLQASPSSLVPAGAGVNAGLRFALGRGDVAGNAIFQRTNQSANGAYWTLSATVNTAVGTSPRDQTIDEIVLIGSQVPGAIVSRATVMREDLAFAPAMLGLFAGERAGIFDLDIPITDDGTYAITTLLRGGSSSQNAVLLRGQGLTQPAWEVLAREGASIPGLTSTTYGNRQFGADLTASGAVYFISDRLNGSSLSAQNRGVFSTGGPVIVIPGGVGSMPVVDPTNQPAPWLTFDPPVQVDATGSHVMVRGSLVRAGFISDDVVSLNGRILARAQTGSSLNVFSQRFGGIVIDPQVRPITGLDDADLAASGDWLIRGRFASVGFNTPVQFMVLGKNLVYQNKLLAPGTALVAGQTEAWGAEAFAQQAELITFTNAKVNSKGEYAVTGFSNQANDLRDGVLVFNGQCVLAREGDRVDVNGDGTGDEQVELLGFRPGTMSISGGEPQLGVEGSILVVADVVQRGIEPNGSQDVFGQVVLRLKAKCCPADVGTEGGAEGSDGLLDNNDFIVFIDWFFTMDPRADIGVSGGDQGQDELFDNNDFIVFINRFFEGC